MEWGSARSGKRKKNNSPPDTNSKVTFQVKKAKSTAGRVNAKPPIPIQPTPKPNKATTSDPVDPTNKEPEDPEDPATPTSKIVKPVFVENNFQVVNNHVNSIQFASKPLLKIINKAKIQVTCHNIADKSKLLASLKEKKLAHFTYSEASEKSTIFVLHGYFKVTADEMLKNITDEGIAATKVTFLSDNEEAPIYIVHFVKGTANFNVLVHNHKTIGNVIVKWEKLDHNRKRPTQCHRCQLWGHSARNCGREIRCVKCPNKHEPGKCERVTREGDAHCVNCKGNHPANSRQCHFFLSYQERTTRRRAPARFTSTPAPWINNGLNPSQHQTDFPPLSARHANTPGRFTYDNEQPHLHPNVEQPVSFTRNQTSSNASRPPKRDSNPSNFASLHSKFQSIPEIDVTLRLFNELIDQLGSTLSHPERLMIMMRYCSPQLTQNAP